MPREKPARATRVSKDWKNLFRMLGLNWLLTKVRKSELRVQLTVFVVPNHAAQFRFPGRQLGCVSAPIPANRGIHDSLVVKNAGSVTSGWGYEI